MRFITLIAFLPLLARADDWPQWGGPTRDNVYHEQGILDSIPKDGLPIRWRIPLSGGYAGPAIAGGRVFVTDFKLKRAENAPRGQIAGIERIQCLNEKDGKQIWSHEYPVIYTFSYVSGPRATPTVDGDRVYTLGGEGDIHCLNVADGKVIWSKRLSGPKAKTPTWGFAGHPLIDGEKLICLGAGDDSVAVAFNKHTGDILWHSLSTTKGSGYCPPMIYSAGGTRQLIIWHPESVNSLNPETGKLYWSIPFGPVRNGVSIAAPVLSHDDKGDTLFIASANEGSLMLRLDPSEPKASILWQRGGKDERHTEALHALMCTPILRDNCIYGICIGGELRCVDARNGDRLWQTYAATTGDEGRTPWATAFLIPTGPHYFIPNENGDLILANLTPKGYEELGRAHILAPVNTDAGRNVVWSPPAFANHSVYWRNDKELVCASLERK
jgi:outer membrane protein assembly factor BamB